MLREVSWKRHNWRDSDQPARNAFLRPQDGETTSWLGSQEDTMRYLRLADSGPCLVVACVILGSVAVFAQCRPHAETDKCTLVEGPGGICMGETSVCAAKQACSNVYVKDCTNAGTNDRTCTRTYKKDESGNAVTRCAYDLIVKLNQIPASDRCLQRAADALLLRQQIDDLILTASLQVDGFVAEIDSETGEIRAVHDRLSDRRDKAVSLSTLGSAGGTGGGAVGSSLALARKTATVGNWVGAAFGGVGTVFGFLGWYQQNHAPHACFPDVGDKHCQVQIAKAAECNPEKAHCSPAMLFHLLYHEPKFDDYFQKYVNFHSDYDPSIENYLKGFDPGAEQSRRGILISKWGDEVAEPAKHQKKKAADASDPPASSENYIFKTGEPYLVAGNRNPVRVSIDDLTDRANKLSDLRSVVARMNRDLSRLTETLAAELQCPAQ